MLDRYRYVSPDEDPEDLMDQDVTFGNETSEYNYEEDDEDLIQDPEKELTLPQFGVPPSPPPSALSTPPTPLPTALNEVIETPALVAAVAVKKPAAK